MLKMRHNLSKLKQWFRVESVRNLSYCYLDLINRTFGQTTSRNSPTKSQSARLQL